MFISKLIAQLQQLLNDAGDVPVEAHNAAGDLDFVQSAYTARDCMGRCVVRITTDAEDSDE